MQGTGVNLGGWLIIEKWLTPSVFEGLEATDEWELSQTEEGRKRIAKHRKTFITEADFRWLRDHGVTHVRLPVPYWAIGDADRYVPAHDELAWAMKMAKKYKLKVLLDLHAAPGGQNPHEHSGQKGQVEWFERRYQERTLLLLTNLAEMYGDNPVLWGIELLNEPEAYGRMFELIRFYRRAYRVLQERLRPGVYTVFHDSFAPLLFTGSLRVRRDHPVAMDVHWYAFPMPHRLSLAWYLRLSFAARWVMLWLCRLWQPVIVGEWSSVLPQRFFDKMPTSKHEMLLGQNIAMQQRAYHRAIGTYYWNYKAEGEGMWNYRSLIESLS